MIKKVLVCMLLLLVSVSFSYAAAGVSPGKYQENFVPGLSKEYQFAFLFEGSQNPTFTLDGPLEEYATITGNRREGDTHYITVKLDLPQELETPGVNKLLISGVESEEDSNSGTIVVKFKVTSVIQIFVPYPGKYAAIDLHVENANAGRDVPYTLRIESLGSESIAVMPKLDITSQGSTIDTITLDRQIILSEESYTYRGLLDTSSFKPGDYNVTAFVDFDGEDDFYTTATFRLGELRIELANYTKKLERDKVNRIDLVIESFWNDPVEELYVNYKMKGESEFQKSRTIRLEPWKKNNIVIFLDTTGITQDTIDLELEFHYEGKIKKETITLDVKQDINWVLISIVAGGIIGLLIIIGLVLFILYLLKKSNGTAKKTEKTKT